MPIGQFAIRLPENHFDSFSNMPSSCIKSVEMALDLATSSLHPHQLIEQLPKRRLVHRLEGYLKLIAEGALSFHFNDRPPGMRS
jgi:hypothetical protein